MQVLSSPKEAKKRHQDCQVVIRRGRIYVPGIFLHVAVALPAHWSA